MKFLPSVAAFLLVAIPAEARTILVEFMLPKGETALMKMNGKELGRNLEAGPHRIALNGQQAAVLEVIREVRYPVEFNPAEVTDIAAAAKGQGGITPQTPARFETTNAGWSFAVASHAGQNHITLVGKATYTGVELLQAVHGEGAGPIMREFTTKKGEKKQQLLSPNVGHSAVSQSTSTNFQLYAIPGKRYEIPVRRGDKTIKLEVVCSYKE